MAACEKVLLFTFMCLKPRIAINYFLNPSHFLAPCTFYTNSVYLPIRLFLVSFYGYIWLCMKVFDKALLKYPAAVQPFVEGTLCLSMVMYGCVWSPEILTYY